MADRGPFGYCPGLMKTPSNTPARGLPATAPEGRTLPRPESWTLPRPEGLVADLSQHDHHVAVLAHAVWEKNGRPPGRQRQYRHEVDAQWRATRHWLEQDLSSRASPGPDASPVGAP